RLICYNVTCDEFLYNNVSDIFSGWCLSNSSPCYQGLRPQRNMSILKAYEQQASVLDLTKYPLINGSRIYIGVANNPYGVSDNVMYISSDGNPCLPGIPALQTNISDHFTANIVSNALTVSGVIIVTNLATLDVFEVPITLSGGNNNFTIDTDLVPAQYSVELNFAHSGTMVAEITDGAAIDYFITDTTGTVDLVYALNNVGGTTIIVNLTFS
ncbi:MAG TPA: hypothetical protein VK890_05870, partial [Bacteroidia bacterium]|nr:hypothetical protein [Bacteroidia bacterium]